MNAIEPDNVYYNKSSIVTTKRQNKVSKESVLCGSDNIGVQGKTMIESRALVRGDLSTVEVGVHCVIGERVVLRPADQRFKGGVAYIPITIGDHVIIEAETIVQAASIGSYVHIGKNCVIGPRCILSSCCSVADGSVLAPGTVIPPFTRFAGVPAVEVGKLPESYQHVCIEHTRNFYRHYQPTTTAAAIANGTNTPGTAATGIQLPTPTPTPPPAPASTLLHNVSTVPQTSNNPSADGSSASTIAKP